MESIMYKIDRHANMSQFLVNKLFVNISKEAEWLHPHYQHQLLHHLAPEDLSNFVKKKHFFE